MLKKLKNHMKYSICLLLLLLPHQVMAGEYVFLGNFGDNLIKIAASPLNIKSEDLSYVIPFTAALGILYLNDGAITESIRRSKSPFLDAVSQSDLLGNGWFTIGLGGVMQVLGKKDRIVGLKLLESFLETGLTVSVIKYGLGRHRPGNELKPYEFAGPSLYDSFPSGHTAIAFSTAAVIGESYQCGFITYPLAFLVAYSRVYKEAHWASDVLAGAFIGILIGNMNKFNNSDISTDAAGEMQLSPLINIKF
jgi:membrane-associated phospholipid phosphatase